MTYDTWKTTPDEELHYRGPTRQQVMDRLDYLDREIGWNIRRLGYLVLGDEDREQTEDFIKDLRDERNALAGYAHAS